MKTLYLDMFAGAAGDMFVAALLDLGIDADAVLDPVRTLPVDGYRVEIRRESRRGIEGTRFEVALAADPGHGHRGFAEIRAMLEQADLPSAVRDRAIAVFRRVAVAEGRVHGIDADHVRFHEVGAIDSIVDIVAGCAAVAALAPDRVEASPPVLGSGSVECRHGRFPVPAPATLEILRGIPVRQVEEEGERVTPTGAALVAEFATRFGPMATGTVDAVGYGVGARDDGPGPNVLRAVVTTTNAVPPPLAVAETDRVAVIETHLDDLSPELLAGACEALMTAGALDVAVGPVTMKKGRAGHRLCVIAGPADADRLALEMLRRTSAFGVRRYETDRWKLSRAVRTITGPFGPVEIKIGRLGGEIIAAAPEYESVRRAAERAGVPEKRVAEWAAGAVARGEIDDVEGDES